MTMTSHALPSEEDRGRALPEHPSGRPWTLSDFIDETQLLDPAMAWNGDGIVILENFVPESLMDAFEEEWLSNNGPLHHHPDGTVDAKRIGGYRETDYMYHEQMMNLFTYKPIHDVVESLIGEPPCVNLGLTGWVSTSRRLHRDEYLDPPGILQDRYAACWLALADVHPDSGPFVYYPGSHLWPGTLSRALAAQAVDLTDPRWPAIFEDVLTPLAQAEAEKRGVELVTYVPKRGTVALWHPKLWHAGSVANHPGMLRKAAIWHMSGIFHRPDFPYRPRRWRDQGFYMPYPEAVSPLEN